LRDPAAGARLVAEAAGELNMPVPEFRPSDAAPSYQRALPAVNIGRSWIIALLVFATGFAGWELKWRAWGAEPTYRNSEGSWHIQRRRIDSGEGDRTVLLGASRVLFDVNLETWQRAMGERPIQLAIEGTTPLPILEELASSPKFTGRVLVGVAPDVFFDGFEYRKFYDTYAKETPTQRMGQWLSMTFIEPFFSFYDDDFMLTTCLRRLPWPRRAGVPHYNDVRRLSVQEIDRDTRMWSKIENDTAYRDFCRSVWSQWFHIPKEQKDIELAKEKLEKQIARSTSAVAKLRERGLQVVFVRPPSDGEYLAWEQRDFPRATTWDVLLQRTGAPGIHFEDHPELQGLNLPEWSHLAAADAEVFTERLCAILQREHGWSRR
jgi:hypothetical protein